jgi:hypothetical protein
MIKWIQVESWGYYADARKTLIDDFFIDRSKAPKLWRLRHGRRGGKEFVVVRIKKGDLHRMRIMTSEALLPLLINGIEAAAKSFGLVCYGKPRTVKESDLWVSNMGQS